MSFALPENLGGESNKGVGIKGSRDANNLDHQAICLMPRTGIVMKYYLRVSNRTIWDEVTKHG